MIETAKSDLSLISSNSAYTAVDLAGRVQYKAYQPVQTRFQGHCSTFAKEKEEYVTYAKKTLNSLLQLCRRKLLLSEKLKASLAAEYEEANEKAATIASDMCALQHEIQESQTVKRTTNKYLRSDRISVSRLQVIGHMINRLLSVCSLLTAKRESHSLT